MRAPLIALPLLLTLPFLAGIHAYGELPATVYYNAVVARVPLSVGVDAARPGAVYSLAGYPGYAALVQVDYGSGRVAFPSTYEPNNGIPPEVKLAIVEAFKALTSTGAGVESRVDAYYLGGGDYSLYVCSAATVSRGPNYQAVYSNGVLLRGALVLGESDGYQVVAVFEIVGSSQGFCGTPIDTKLYEAVFTAASAVIAAAAILSYLAARRESLFKLGAPS